MDRETFGALVERYQRRIFRVCMAVTKNQDAAEDCMQKTFILALENLGQFRGEAQFSTWLTRIALNVAVSHLRRENGQAGLHVSLDAAETGELPFSLPDHRPGPETDCWRSEVRRLIRQALESLSPRLRMVFLLRDMEELSTEETARILGITEAAVKTRLLRARLQLRELLAPALAPSRHPSAPCFAVQ
jgi:RNA polymerase sigma-70 factor (ECF subfamily)